MLSTINLKENSRPIFGCSTLYLIFDILQDRKGCLYYIKQQNAPFQNYYFNFFNFENMQYVVVYCVIILQSMVQKTQNGIFLSFLILMFKLYVIFIQIFIHYSAH